MIFLLRDLFKKILCVTLSKADLISAYLDVKSYKLTRRIVVITLVGTMTRNYC
jgi:hypothetical protein